MVLIPFLVFLTGLFLVYALFLFTSRSSDAKREKLNERLAEAIRSSAHSGDADVQLARQELLSEIPWANRILLKLEISKEDQANDRSGRFARHGSPSGFVLINSRRPCVPGRVDGD